MGGRPVDWDAIVLAGGAARRFGSDKTRHVVGDRSLLDHVLGAAAGAGRRVVVGEERPLHPASPDVHWVREEPPGSGPAQALVAALPEVTAPHVVLLAADLPHVTAATLDRLLDASTHRPAALVDADGRVQLLCLAVETDRLRQAAARRPTWAGASVRSLLAPLRLVHVPAVGAEAHDVDEPGDVPSSP